MMNTVVGTSVVGDVPKVVVGFYDNEGTFSQAVYVEWKSREEYEAFVTGLITELQTAGRVLEAWQKEKVTATLNGVTGVDRP